MVLVVNFGLYVYLFFFLFGCLWLIFWILIFHLLDSLYTFSLPDMNPSLFRNVSSSFLVCDKLNCCYAKPWTDLSYCTVFLINWKVARILLLCKTLNGSFLFLCFKGKVSSLIVQYVLMHKVLVIMSLKSLLCCLWVHRNILSRVFVVPL